MVHVHAWYTVCERTWLKKSITNILITLSKLGNGVHGFQITFKSILFWNVRKGETADVKCKMFLSVVLVQMHSDSVTWHQIARLSDDRLPQLTQRSRIKYSWLLQPHILILTSTYRQVIYLPSPHLARAKHWIGRVRRLTSHVTLADWEPSFRPPIWSVSRCRSSEWRLCRG